MLSSDDDSPDYRLTFSDTERGQSFEVVVTGPARKMWGLDNSADVWDVAFPLALAVLDKRDARLIPDYESSYVFDAQSKVGTQQEAIACIGFTFTSLTDSLP